MTEAPLALPLASPAVDSFRSNYEGSSVLKGNGVVIFRESKTGDGDVDANGNDDDENT
ncbi:MAG TPA: hypothetical protein VEZ11_06610 [Thermoanaerobaculia bacterium]|nr:hypothetical protein [Thermoanaerobaculia bacterium]